MINTRMVTVDPSEAEFDHALAQIGADVSIPTHENLLGRPA